MRLIRFDTAPWAPEEAQDGEMWLNPEFIAAVRRDLDHPDTLTRIWTIDDPDYAIRVREPIENVLLRLGVPNHQIYPSG